MPGDKIFQFKIMISGFRPAIWRRIQVPEDWTFRDLHFAIQRAMGWRMCHLHGFEMLDPKTEDTVHITDNELGTSPEEQFLDQNTAKISDFFNEPKTKALYIYDWGDEWRHIVELEAVVPRKPEEKYPICIDGKRACPPENCGGTDEFKHIVKVLANPKHEEYEEYNNWLSQNGYNPYNPAHFDPKMVKFF